MVRPVGHPQVGSRSVKGPVGPARSGVDTETLELHRTVTIGGLSEGDGQVQQRPTLDTFILSKEPADAGECLRGCKHCLCGHNAAQSQCAHCATCLKYSWMCSKKSGTNHESVVERAYIAFGDGTWTVWQASEPSMSSSAMEQSAHSEGQSASSTAPTAFLEITQHLLHTHNRMNKSKNAVDSSLTDMIDLVNNLTSIVAVLSRDNANLVSVNLQLAQSVALMEVILLNLTLSNSELEDLVSQLDATISALYDEKANMSQSIYALTELLQSSSLTVQGLNRTNSALNGQIQNLSLSLGLAESLVTNLSSVVSALSVANGRLVSTIVDLQSSNANLTVALSNLTESLSKCTFQSGGLVYRNLQLTQINANLTLSLGTALGQIQNLTAQLSGCNATQSQIQNDLQCAQSAFNGCVVGNCMSYQNPLTVCYPNCLPVPLDNSLSCSQCVQTCALVNCMSWFNNCILNGPLASEHNALA